LEKGDGAKKAAPDDRRIGRKMSSEFEEGPPCRFPGESEFIRTIKEKLQMHRRGWVKKRTILNRGWIQQRGWEYCDAFNDDKHISKEDADIRTTIRDPLGRIHGGEVDPCSELAR
jgi:hypothetical protein